MKMELDSAALVLESLKLIDDTKKTATQIAVNRADFLMMAYYLVELRPFLEELNKQQDFLVAKPVWPSLQRFTNVVEGMNVFTKGCASRSRIYLLCHSHDLVQEMMKSFKQLAECVALILSESFEIPSSCRDTALETQRKLNSPTFFHEPGQVELARGIMSSLNDSHGCSSDDDEQRQRAMDLLQKIAKHMNVPVSEVSELKLELQEDLKEAEVEGREADVQELRGLCAFFNLAKVMDDKRIQAFAESPLHDSMHVFEIPKPFFCPITKEVMREPVMLEQGHTYEKAAIQEWFERGNKTCPDTGQELQSLELIPNMKLQQAMDEYFSNMYKRQLIYALQKLRAQGTAADVEATINTVRTILDVDSKYRQLLVSLDGIGPLVSVLKQSAPQVRERILRILYNTALLGYHYKLSIIEADAIPIFLRILQKSPGDNGGPVQLLWELSKCEVGSKAILSEKGSILIIASAFNLCQNDQKLLAEKLLGNLCRFDESVIIETARSSIFGPFITTLTSGNEASKFKMASAISVSLELNEHSSSVLVKAGVVPPLLHLLQYGSFESKQAAGSALHRLSTADANKTVFAKEGAIPILVKLLDTTLPQLKLNILAILSNLATNRQNAAEIDKEGTVTHRLGILLSGDTEMQEYSLKTLQCMARDSHAVRSSVVDSKLVPSIYRLLQNEGLSSNCRGSILSLLCYLAEDHLTRHALVTSTDMVKFLIGLMEGSMGAEDKEVLLSLLAGLSKIDEMKSWMISESYLLTMCTGYLKLKGSHKFQESAAVIFSQLCDPDLIEKSIQMALSRQGLISTLVEVLSSSASTERAKRYASVTLGHFSKCTPCLTERQSFLKQLLARLGVKRFKICEVHSGKCNVKGTFCIVEAGAVPVLINMVKEGGSQTADQAVDALNTLLVNKENTGRGVDFLVRSGIIPSLVSIVGKSNLSTEKAAKVMEVIFRIRKYRDDRYSKVAKGSLATILATGTADARKAAATALMHLKEMSRDSVYTLTTTST